MGARRIDYRCPGCRRKAFDAASPIPGDLLHKCPKCGLVALPVPDAGRPAHQTLLCERCGRTQHVERPVQERTHCIVCGTRTLVVISETPAAAPRARPPATEPALVRRGGGR